MALKPLIGIVSKEVDIHFNDWTVNSTSNEIRYALTKNNARAIGILPPHKKHHIQSIQEPFDLSQDDINMLEETLSLCNGIILQGGLSAFRYEEYIARYARRNNIPLLGICAGFNVMVISAGGQVTLLDKNHKHQAPELKYAHTVQIDKDSLFYDIVKTTSLRVNSIHNYTATDVQGYKSVGITPDKLIEVIEDRNCRFNIGVHFHPELLIEEDKKMNMIFQSFIDAASF